MAKGNKSGGVRSVQGMKMQSPGIPSKRATGGRDLFGMLGQRLGLDLNTTSAKQLTSRKPGMGSSWIGDSAAYDKKPGSGTAWI